MAWVVISANDVDAKSPITETLMGDIKGDLDYLKSALTDAGSAPQGVSTTTITTSGAGTIGGNLTVTGQLTVGSFFVSDNIQNLWAWGYI